MAKRDRNQRLDNVVNHVNDEDVRLDRILTPSQRVARAEANRQFQNWVREKREAGDRKSRGFG